MLASWKQLARSLRGEVGLLEEANAVLEGELAQLRLELSSESKLKDAAVHEQESCRHELARTQAKLGAAREQEHKLEARVNDLDTQVGRVWLEAAMRKAM